MILRRLYKRRREVNFHEIAMGNLSKDVVWNGRLNNSIKFINHNTKNKNIEESAGLVSCKNDKNIT